MWKNYVLLIALLLPAFCAANLCRGRNETKCNIFPVDCANPNGVIMGCGGLNYAAIDLQPLQAAIVEKHNKVRNRIAGGNLPSTRMGTLRWSTELEMEAKKQACFLSTRSFYCSNTLELWSVGYIGGNLSWPTTTVRTDESVIFDIIDRWIWHQNRTRMSDIRGYPIKKLDADDYRRIFTQLVRGSATRFGCTALKAQQIENGVPSQVIYFVCVYDSSPAYERPVYSVGPTATQCVTGNNPNFPNLCSTNEVFDVNEFWENSIYRYHDVDTLT